MADLEIRDLTEKTVVDASDKFMLQDGADNESKFATADNVIPDGTVTPVKRSGGFAIGVIAGATVGTTGNKAITGVGFTPKLVRFTIMPTTSTSTAVMGVGAMTPTAQFAMSIATLGSAQRRTSSTDRCFVWSNSTSTNVAAEYVSMDADGFTVNVVTAQSDFDVAWEAYA